DLHRVVRAAQVVVGRLQLPVLQTDLHEHVARRLAHGRVPDRGLDREHVDPGRGTRPRLLEVLDVDHRHLTPALVGADVGDGRTRTIQHGCPFTRSTRTTFSSAPGAAARFRRGLVGRDLAVHPDRDVHRHQVPGPDPVHRRNAHANAAVRRRTVRDAVRPVHRFTPGEVLRAVDLGEVAVPPTLLELAVHLVQPGAGDGVADLTLPGRVLVGLVVRDLAAGRRVEDPLGVAVGHE